MVHLFSVLISVVVFGLTWSVSTDVPNRCPQPTETNPDPPAYYYVHPDDCGYYFTCAHGVPYLISCAPGTRFSEVFHTCAAEFSHYDTCSRDNAARECSRGATLIGHPTICQRYFNCSDTSSRGIFNSLEPFESECPYPQLFDISERKCKSFKEAYCGPYRVPGIDPCSYRQNQCLVFRCSVTCNYNHPSCLGLADGPHENPYHIWSSHYIVCDTGRTLKLQCPELYGTIGLFSPIKKTCVTIWELPRELRGAQPSCEGKADGQYLTEENPAVYYSCPGAAVSYCPNGSAYDLGTKTCQS